jgi:Holliday junction resolvase RusA-like endonuclease
MNEAGVRENNAKANAPLPSPALSKTWKIPCLPVSMNKLYSINFVKRCVYMTSEARTFKNNTKLCIGNFSTTKSDKLTLSLDVHTDWFFKNGNPKKSDIQNLIKVVVDAVSERLGFDDSQIWSFSANKIQSTDNYCTITLEKQNEEMPSVEKA